MIKKIKGRKRFCLLAVCAALLAAACLQPANVVPSLEYTPQGLQDVSANFTVSPGSDMIVVGFEGGAFQSGVVATDFQLNLVNGDSVTINMPVVDSETQAVLPFDGHLEPGTYNLTIKASAFSKNPSRIVVKAVKGDGTWSAPTENTGFNRNSIYAMTYGAGKYLAAGGGGNLAYSRDGDTWTNIPPGSTVTQNKFSQDVSVRSIAYGNGTFYAVGDKGQVAYSDDGLSWDGYTEENFKDNDNYLSINAIIYGGGRFLAAGEKGRMWCQADDGNWTWVEDTKFGDFSIRALAWGRIASGENRYVAAGDAGQLCFSGDGINWTYSGNGGKGNAKDVFGNVAVNGLAFGNGVFIAVLDNGKIYLSDDGGEKWAEKHPISGGTGLLSVVYGSGTFIATGHNGVALISVDEKRDDWTPMAVSFSTGDQISCAAYAGGRFILAGNPYSGGNSRIAGVYIKPGAIPVPESPVDVASTFNLDAADNQITITLSGGAFKEMPLVDDFDLSSAGFTSGIIERNRENPLIVIFKGITVSAPGNGKTIKIKASALSAKATSATVTTEKKLTWTGVQDTGFDTSNIRGIAYGNGKYVAVGAGRIVTSTDGLSWTEVTTDGKPWAASNDYVYFHGIAFGNSRFVAVGYWVNGGENGNGWGVAAVSTDGTKWTMKDRILTTGGDSAHIYAIAWTGQNFVAVGRWGRSATSTDGANWTQCQVAPFDYKDIFAVASGNGKVVIGGSDGKLAFSTDNGSNWTWVANNFFGPDKAIRTITFYSNNFIAAGDGGNMKIAASSQITAGTGSDGGDNWQGKDSKFGETGIRALASRGGKIIAVGDNGKMSESTDGSAWTALNAGTSFGQSGFTAEEQIACIVYGGSRFVIGGNAYSENASKIACSNNQ